MRFLCAWAQTKLAWPVLGVVFAMSCGKQPQGLRQPEKPPAALAKNERVAAIAADPQLEKGRELYGRICAVCHGANGEGYKADAAPALNHPAFLGSVSDILLRDAIKNGRNGSTMSAWSKRRGGPLDDADVEAVIAFIRTWYQGEKLVLDERPTRGEHPADVEKGGALYKQHCMRCHGEHGIEGPNARIADPPFLGRATVGFLRKAIADGRPPTPMEGFGQKLGPQGVDDVIAYVRSLLVTNAVAMPPHMPVEQPLPLPPLPLNPKGKQPVGFELHPKTTPLDVVARELKRHKRMALLDARAPSDYLREHIKGAASVPYYDPSPFFDKLPKDTWLVAYCACPHAESQTLAQKLMDAGFKKVTVLDEGIGAWKVKGHPIESSPPPAAPSPSSSGSKPASSRKQ